MWLINESFVDPLDAALNREVSCSFSRGTGPGGQKRNKTSTKATINWDVGHSAVWNGNVDAQVRFKELCPPRMMTTLGAFYMSSDHTRNSEANKKICFDYLKNLIRQAFVEPVERKETQPTFGSTQRRMDDKRATQMKKQNRRFVPGFE